MKIKNMKKIVLMLFVASWAFVQMSCSKDSSNSNSTTTPTPTVDNCLVTKVTDQATSESTTITYDANKRMLSQLNDSMGKTFAYNLTWTDAFTGTIEVKSNGTTTNGGTFYVNNSGYPTRVTIGNQTQGYIVQNTYNSDGTAKTTEITLNLNAQTSVSLTTNYEYSGGNLVKTTSTNTADPAAVDITEYTYYTDKLDNRAKSKAKNIFNLEEPGVGSKNLVKTKVTSSGTTTYTYSIAENRVTQEKETANGEDVISLFTYKCD
jgi:hypothetical protein